MSQTFRSNRRCRGFSLIELLVVIGIVALLMAIILPVVSRVRRQAQVLACVSNVRQLSQVFAMYVNENRNSSIPFAFDAEHSWVADFRSAAHLPDKLFLCPLLGSATALGFGNAFESWTLELISAGQPTRISGSYGFNGWLLRWESTGRGGEKFSGGDTSLYATLSSRGSERIPVFADAIWLDGWPRADDPAPHDLVYGDRGHQKSGPPPNDNMLARFTIARHAKKVNISFVDGHAETVPLDDLKRLKWHEGFTYQDWSPPLPLN